MFPTKVKKKLDRQNGPLVKLVTIFGFRNWLLDSLIQNAGSENQWKNQICKKKRGSDEADLQWLHDRDDRLLSMRQSWHQSDAMFRNIRKFAIHFMILLFLDTLLFLEYFNIKE